MLLRRLPGRYLALCVLLLFLAGFALSALAPGNAVRQARITALGRPPLSFFRTVLYSFRAAFLDMTRWAAKRLSTRPRARKVLTFLKAEKSYPAAFMLSLLLAAAVFLPAARVEGRTGVRARNSLTSGEAARFSEEYARRIWAVRDTPNGTAVIKRYTTVPSVFHAGLELWSKGWWVNNAFAAFYGGGSITLEDYLNDPDAP